MGREADRRSKPLALTMGDPAGIGLDITLMAWRERQSEHVPPFAFVGCPDALAARARALDIPVAIEPITSFEQASAAFATRLPVLSVALSVPHRAGSPDARNAAAVIAAIEMAVSAVLEGEAAAVVTNPIAKNILKEAGFQHPGHTEFLGHLASGRKGGRIVKPVMMLASEELKVVPLTIHVPLFAVPRLVTRTAIFETIRVMWDALRRDFGVDAPRIAVAGLNPHAGEKGTIGTEDRDVIGPAVRDLRSEGFGVTGPHSADTLFHAQARRDYDAVLAMYHDQALIPIKTLAFDRGVNVTLGLPFVRTSPDHGTAFDIAGRGIANPRSLIESLKLAAVMAARRAQSDQSPKVVS